MKMHISSSRIFKISRGATLGLASSSHIAAVNRPDSENLATTFVNVLRIFHTARKGTKFAGSVGHAMTKMLSASGGLRL